jgi:hypothetical protein
MHQVSVATLRARRPNINTQHLEGATNTALAPIWKGEKTARVAMQEAIGELNAIAGSDEVLL